MSALRIDHLNRSFGSLVTTMSTSTLPRAAARHHRSQRRRRSLVNQIGNSSHRVRAHLVASQTSPATARPNQPDGRGPHFQRNNLFQNLGDRNLRLALRCASADRWFLPAGGGNQPPDVAGESLMAGHLGTDAPDYPQSFLRRAAPAEIGMAWPAIRNSAARRTSLGHSPAETVRMIDLIANLPRTLAILMIEHDMKVVFSVADRVTVLYYGKILATGTPDEIQANARVREVYLGMRH
jgi:branched-chain amino acid transport system ATP-binding protein